MLITFSGLDGAGKSTLSEGLKKKLEGRDRRVAVSHMYRDVGLYACARAVLIKVTGGGRGLKGEEEAAGRVGPKARGGLAQTKTSRLANAVAWNKTLRLFVFPVDLLIFLGYRLYVERVRGRVLIMDRYFYDTLVDVAVLGGWRGARLLRRLTPTPNVPVYLDITPEEAYARKGEHSVAYLGRRRAAYRKLFPNGRRGVVLDAGGDREATLSALERVVLERMEAL